jgi:DNA-binding transcriptional LysR family regulator
MAPVLFGRMYVMPIVAGLLSEHSELSLRMTLDDRVMRLAEEGIEAAIQGLGIARLFSSSEWPVRAGSRDWRVVRGQLPEVGAGICRPICRTLARVNRQPGAGIGQAGRAARRILVGGR